MTDFLSTSRTATSATTRPALTTMFWRLVATTPVWILLTLPPWRIITTKRVALIVGTVLLSWHSRPMRVSRTLLWRSAIVRCLAEWATGLEFDKPTAGTTGQNGFTTSSKKKSSSTKSALSAALTGLVEPGVCIRARCVDGRAEQYPAVKGQLRIARGRRCASQVAVGRRKSMAG